MSKKAAGRVFASLMASSILNAVLQSIVTAARDDDDDKTYAEKYLAQLLPNFIDNANPLNQIAFVKDVMSLFNGYDVSRTDMSIISDFVVAVQNIHKDSVSLEDKLQGLAGSVGALLGLPVKNVWRDIESAVNVIKSAKSDMKAFNKTAATEKFKEELKSSIVTDNILADVFGIDILEEKDKNTLMYEAIINGDKEMQKRISDNVENPDTYIKGGLMSDDKRVAEAGIAYSDGDVTKYISTAEELEKDGFDYELALKTIKSYKSALEEAKGYLDEKDVEAYEKKLQTLCESGVDKATVEKAIKAVKKDSGDSDKESTLYTGDDLYNAVEIGEQKYIDKIITSNENTDIKNGKSKDEAKKNVKKSISSKYRQDYIDADDDGREEIENKLAKTGLFSKDDYTGWVSDSYDSEKFIKVLNKNNTQEIRSYVSKRLAAKITDGQSKDKAISTMRSDIAKQYREKYKNGNANERNEILTIMAKTGLYGKDTAAAKAWIDKWWYR